MSNVLSNGNRGARVTEVDPETQDVVFELLCFRWKNFHR